MNFAKHTRFHVIEQMTVIRPVPQGIGSDEIAQALARLHVDRMFAQQEPAVRAFDFAPHPVQVDRVIHHAVVDEHDAQALAVVELQRRSEEHTSELQSLAYLVCRLLLEKKKKNVNSHILLLNCYA